MKPGRRAEVDETNRSRVIVGAGAHRLSVDLDALEVTDYA